LLNKEKFIEIISNKSMNMNMNSKNIEKWFNLVTNREYKNGNISVGDSSSFLVKKMTNSMEPPPAQSIKERRGYLKLPNLRLPTNSLKLSSLNLQEKRRIDLPLFIDFNNSSYRYIQNSRRTNYTILISPNQTQLFKKPTTNKNRNVFMSECEIYNYLRSKSPQFVENCTCYIGCYTNGLLLKYGGLSIKRIIQSNTNIQLPINFDKLFQNILELHLLRVTHNDLNCGNILAKDGRLIDFGFSKILNHLDRLDIKFLNDINNFFKILFVILLNI
jgi:hypothetical protein